MRVLLTSIPQTGHISPLLSFAAAFTAQGDEVIFASGPDAEEPVGASGVTFRSVGPAYGTWYQTLRGRIRGVPGDGLAPSRVERYFAPRLFGEVGMALMIDDLLDLCRDAEPDLLVFDPFVFAAPLAGALLGIPLVQHTVGPLLDEEVLQLVADAVSPIWREFGLDVPPAAGVYTGTTVTICPPSLDPAGAGRAGAIPLRPAEPLIDTGSLPPIELPAGPDPLVYVTLGTFSNSPAVFKLIMEALVGMPARAVVTVGSDVDPAAVGPAPPNVRVERFVPQGQLLPHCAAVVHHAGAGTTWGVLAHGLPAVAVPQSADNFQIAERLAAAGAAVALMPSDAAVDSVRDAVMTVLTRREYRDAAARLALEIAGMPPAAEVVATLRHTGGRGRG